MSRRQVIVNNQLISQDEVNIDIAVHIEVIWK